MARQKTVFVVSRLNWRPVMGGEWWLTPGGARLASFATRDEAEVERARREANARGRVNPFRCGLSFAELTTLPEPIFLDWVSDTGLTPPAAKKGEPRDWAAWWDATRPEMNTEQHAKLWEGLNRVHFFRVDERPDVPVGYAVMSPIWQDNGEGEFLRGEGGTVEAVYRSHERAETEARRWAGSLGRDRDWHPTGADLFDPETYWRIGTAGGPFDFIEIELHGEKAGKLYLVVRRTWTGPTRDMWLNHEERAPVRGFTSKKEAEVCRRELEAEFRREWNPWPWFAVYWDWAGQTEQFEQIKAAAVELGLIMPEAELKQWWWTIPQPLTAEHRAALWAAVPDNHAYEVIETQLVK